MEQTLFSLNGKIVAPEQAVVSVTDRGFMYADGVFETIHAYGAAAFLLDEHLDRMEHGLAALHFAERPARRELKAWVRRAVRAAGFSEANVRATVTRGAGPSGPFARGPFKPTTVVIVRRFRRRPERDYTRGVNAVLASFRRQDAGILASLKTMAYVEQVLAKREAQAAGADEALLLNTSGLLCEGASSNLALVRGGRLLVPDPPRVGALPGVTQKLAMQLARRLGIPVCLTSLGPWDLWAGDEAFLSSAMRELTPLVRVNGRPIGGGRPGPITLRLIAAYRKRVERDCRGYRFRAARAEREPNEGLGAGAKTESNRARSSEAGPGW